MLSKNRKWCHDLKFSLWSKALLIYTHLFFLLEVEEILYTGPYRHASRYVHTGSFPHSRGTWIYRSRRQPVTHREVDREDTFSLLDNIYGGNNNDRPVKNKRILYFRNVNTVKHVLSGHSKRRPNIAFQDQLLLNAGQMYCRMLQESILQYFWPSLSYHLPLRPLFCLFLSGRSRQVLLYKWELERADSFLA